VYRALGFLLAFTIAQPLFAQEGESSLSKAKNFILLEEFDQASFFLKQSSKLQPNANKEEAELALAELLLLQKQLDSADRIIRNLSSRKNSAQNLFVVALQQFQNNQVDEASAIFNQVISKSRQQPTLLAKAHYYQGVIEFRKRSAQSTTLAISHLQKSISYFQRDSVHTYLKLAVVRLQLADAFGDSRDLTAGLAQLKIAVKILEGSPYAKPVYFANAFGVEARICYSNGKYLRAKELFERQLQLQSKSSIDSSAIGTIYANIGLCYDDLSDYSNCENAYAKVVQYWNYHSERPDRLAGFTNNYALFLHTAVQESSSAISALEKVIPKIESGSIQSKFRIYQTYFNLATIHYDMGEYVACKKYIDHLDAFVHRDPTAVNDNARFKISLLKAMWLRKENKVEEAFTLGNLLYNQLDSLSFKDVDQANFFVSYADIFMSADSVLPSAKLLHRAKLIYDQQQFLSKQIEVNNLLAINFYQAKWYDSAYFYADLSLRQNTIKDPSLIYPFRRPQEAIQACYISVASFLQQYQQTNQKIWLEKAIPFEQLGISLIRSIRKNLYSDADRVSYNASVSKFYEGISLLQLYRWKLSYPDAPGQFFEYAEESKFQALANSLSHNRVNSFNQINAALVEEERLLAKQKVLENNHLVQLISNSEGEEVEQRQSVARGYLQKLENRHERFLDSLRINFKGYYELKYGGDPITLSNMQRELQSDQLLLQIKVIDSLVVVQAIAKKYSSFYLLSNAAGLQSQVKKLRNLLHFNLETDFRVLASEVYKILIKPALDEALSKGLKLKSLLIVPDDYFYLLPFEALVSKTDPFRYLIQQYEITYGYSCNLMIQSKRSAAVSTGNSFLGVAPHFNAPEGVTEDRSVRASNINSYESFGFQPLKENETEISLIKEVADQSTNSLLLSGENANEEQLKKINLSKFNYIHFATHGFVNSSNAGFSGLALTNAGKSEDNILYGSEIYNLNMRADLVCLSACETGLGQRMSGEGLMGLGRAFFYAGARNLLVSLWKVPDKSTSLFMIDFYKQLFNDKNRASTSKDNFSASLRNAKLKMIKNPVYQNPHYWAPFILVGSY
jgi:CHAT domain-containing protein